MFSISHLSLTTLFQSCVPWIWPTLPLCSHLDPSSVLSLMPNSHIKTLAHHPQLLCLEPLWIIFLKFLVHNFHFLITYITLWYSWSFLSAQLTSVERTIVPIISFTWGLSDPLPLLNSVILVISFLSTKRNPPSPSSLNLGPYPAAFLDFLTADLYFEHPERLITI